MVSDDGFRMRGEIIEELRYSIYYPSVVSAFLLAIPLTIGKFARIVEAGSIVIGSLERTLQRVPVPRHPPYMALMFIMEMASSIGVRYMLPVRPLPM